MNENDIRAAMHNLDTTLPAGSLEPRQVASRVVERHQRQMRLLTGISIFLWLLAAAGVLYVVYGALWHFYPRQKLLMRDAALGKLTAEKIDALQATHFMVIEAATIILAASFIALTLAALCHCAAGTCEPPGDFAADKSAVWRKSPSNSSRRQRPRSSLSIVSMRPWPRVLRALRATFVREALPPIGVTKSIRYAKNNPCMLLAFVHQPVDQ